MEKDDKTLSEKEKLEVRQTALIQAIADNKAVKRVIGDNTIFWIGIALIGLNLIAAILALIIGCPCEDKPFWHWIIFGIYVALIFAVFVLNLIEHINAHNKKLNDDIDQKANSGSMPLNAVLQMYIDDTKEIDKQIKVTRRNQLITALITVICTVSIIIAIII